MFKSIVISYRYSDISSEAPKSGSSQNDIWIKTRVDKTIYDKGKRYPFKKDEMRIRLSVKTLL